MMQFKVECYSAFSFLLRRVEICKLHYFRSLAECRELSCFHSPSSSSSQLHFIPLIFSTPDLSISQNSHNILSSQVHRIKFCKIRDSSEFLSFMRSLCSYFKCLFEFFYTLEGEKYATNLPSQFSVVNWVVKVRNKNCKLSESNYIRNLRERASLTCDISE